VSEKLNSIKVFVFLGYGFGADSWRERFTKREIPGLNEQLPYGYYHAAGNGWNIEYSQDRKENRFVKLARRILVRFLGFDLVHAWRNRKKLEAADFVWTHTEREHLAVLLVFWISKPKHLPKVIAQCVWLFDRWSAFSTLRRRFYSHLLKGADIITTQSPEDLAAAKRLFPDSRCKLVLSGAAVEDLVVPRRAAIHRPVRLAALGNDMHRDWETLVQAFGKAEEAFQVKIVSTKFNSKIVDGCPSVSVVKATTEQEIKEIYAWADIVIVPLKFNLHASGITVVFEAIVSGRPVICTDTGGMRAYFADDEVRYVSLGSPAKLREAVRCLASDDDLRFQLVANSQRKLVASALTKQGYAQRHRQLSESLLKSAAAREGRASVETSPGTDSTDDQKVKVFVHLGHGFGEDAWRERFARGLIPGLNEPLPYGYYRAADSRWSITHSQDVREGRLTELCRRGLARWFGFDLVHAWRNRKGLFNCDIVWTHTEREHLAALIFFAVARWKRRPAIIAQCVWLFDRWTTLSRWKRRVYTALLKHADAVTTHSLANLERAKAVLSNERIRLVMFGIHSLSYRKAARPKIANPLRVVALGNDMHRDWNTLISAFGGVGEYVLVIASESLTPRTVNNAENITRRPVKTVSDLTELYEWADIVVVPLKENSHASGITVVLEAALSGLPVVCSDTGGMRAYFSDEEIRYVPVGDPIAMRAAVHSIAGDDSLRQRMVIKAQERIEALNLTAQGFADRHRELSEEILFGKVDKDSNLHTSVNEPTRVYETLRRAQDSSDLRSEGSQGQPSFISANDGQSLFQIVYR
jgi:glycosyltransferase involved in cell wall biosynthesis